MAKTYTREEVDEILRRALSEQALDGISHDELVAAAREVGISEAAIEAAAADLGERRQVKERAIQIRERKRRAFIRHFVTFLTICTALVGFDYMDGGAWFAHVPIIIWTMLLILMGMRQLAPDQEAVMRQAERELEKEARRAARRHRLEARKKRAVVTSGPAAAAQEFEAAVEEGVSSLLSAAARAIRGITPEHRRYRVDGSEEPEEPTSSREVHERRRQRR